MVVLVDLVSRQDLVDKCGVKSFDPASKRYVGCLANSSEQLALQPCGCCRWPNNCVPVFASHETLVDGGSAPFQARRVRCEGGPHERSGLGAPMLVVSNVGVGTVEAGVCQKVAANTGCSFT